MSQTVLDAVFLPATVAPESLADQTVIVVDVLRATTTIINALANGVDRVIPSPSVAAARELQQQLIRELGPHVLLGGERQGQIVPGFTNGNSPREYTADTVAGKTLVLATTNGTVAMEHCRQAKQVLIGAMVNIAAVADAVVKEAKVTVLCSGTDGNITSEDMIFAGAMIARIQEVRFNQGSETGQLTDTALVAVNHWKQVSSEVTAGKPLAEFFRTARGGINLFRIGLDDDIVFASQIDTLPLVPELCLKSWTVRVATSDAAIASSETDNG